MFRLGFAHVHFRRSRTSGRPKGLTNAAISVIYPVYRESPEVLETVMERACRCLALPNVEFVFVDDGSPNRDELEPIYRRFRANPRIQVLYQENRGKREAQYTGLAVATGEYVVTVDSDTLIDPEGLACLTAPFQRDARIGAVCGEVLVENASHNLLTKMQAVRYWTSFNVERAAQSLFRSVLCCCGPFSAYRATILHGVKDAYVNQSFCGRRCTYGDDRHLTNLVLAEGSEVVYQPGAVAWTFVPTTLGEYIRQQTRWNKSFYREILWTLKIADRVHPYSLLDMLLQPLLFLAFTLSLSHALYLVWMAAAPEWILYYLAILVTMAFARGAYGLFRTRDPRFLLLVAYGFLHVFVLIPVRFKSLLTLTDNRWGTRTAGQLRTPVDFSFWAACYAALLLANVALLTLFEPSSVVELDRSQTLSKVVLEAWRAHIAGAGAIVLTTPALVVLLRYLSKRRRPVPKVVHSSRRNSHSTTAVRNGKIPGD
ncbi:MAG: glycosyltransferase [Planctomycetaceae bacterium]